jgi:hypothetical protein
MGEVVVVVVAEVGWRFNCGCSDTDWVAGLVAGSEDAEALDKVGVASSTSTLLLSSTLCSDSEGDEEGMVVDWVGDGEEGRMEVGVAAAGAGWERRMSRDWVAMTSS